MYVPKPHDSSMGGVTTPTMKLQIQFVEVERATPLDLMALGNTSLGSAHPRGAYVHPYIRMKMNAMATAAHPASVCDSQVFEYTPTSAAIIPHETKPPAPPMIASGRRPTLSTIRKHRETATSCSILKTPDMMRDIS